MSDEQKRKLLCGPLYACQTGTCPAHPPDLLVWYDAGQYVDYMDAGMEWDAGWYCETCVDEYIHVEADPVERLDEFLAREKTAEMVEFGTQAVTIERWLQNEQ